jgi:hypothetical protein
MRRLLLFLPFVCLACSAGSTAPTLSAPSAALSSAATLEANGPARYQMTSTTYHMVVLFGTYVHDYVLTTNPCNSSTVMTGALISNDGFQPSTTETVTFTIDPATGVLNYHAIYDDPYYANAFGVHYNYDAAFDGNTYVGPGAGSVVLTVTRSSTSYQSHGDFVSRSPDKNDATHSCIGMPIVS